MLAAGIASPAGAGTTWRIVPSPSPGVARHPSGLKDVVCLTATWCEAVGYYSTSSSTERPLVEHWNGVAWSVQAAPSVPGVDRLWGVSCTSTTFCLAVGEVGGTATLAERWNGAKWTISPTPSTSHGGIDELRGISCVSSTACMAVGTYFAGTGLISRGLSELWNGSSWHVVATPGTDVVSVALNDVSCTPTAVVPRGCTAVGSATLSTGATQRTVIERYGPTGWAFVAHPSPGLPVAELLGVSCVGATSCTAVGDQQKVAAGGARTTLVLRYAASSWTIIASANPSATKNYLADVSCTAPSLCYAAGAEESSSLGRDQTLIEALHGSSWATTPTPDRAPAQTNDLSAVSCTLGRFCVSVGWTPSAPLVEAN